MSNHHALDLIKNWIKGLGTGCAFAARLLNQKDMKIFDMDVDPELLTEILEATGEQHKTAVLFFPRVDSQEAMVQALCDVLKHERWQGAIPHEDEEAFCLTLEWMTAEGCWSNCNGFAPLLTMPAPRRAPYFSIALWPGVKRTEEEKVSFADIPHNLIGEPRRHARQKTIERVGALMDLEGAISWRNVTFRLDIRYKDTIASCL